MASIGGIPCTFVHGAMPVVMPLKAKRTSRPGVDGEGIWYEGRRGAEFQLEAVVYSTKGGARAWGNSLESLQGLMVAVVTSEGQSSTRVFLEQVGPVEVKAGWCSELGTTHIGRAKIKGVLL